MILSLIAAVSVFFSVSMAAADGNTYQQKIDTFAANAFAVNDGEFPKESYKTLEELTAHQGKPERAARISDRLLFREGDYWLGLEYPDKYLQYYYSSLKDAFFVRMRRFFANDVTYKYGIRIGMTEEALMQTLGVNSGRERSDNGAEVWYYPDVGNVQLIFRFTPRHELEAITIVNEGVKGSQ